MVNLTKVTLILILDSTVTVTSVDFDANPIAHLPIMCYY